MTVVRPNSSDIQDAIEVALERGRRGLDDVAQILCSSPSTVQRALDEKRTTFTAARRDVQLRIALGHLKDGRPAWWTAERVMVSPDYLREIVKEFTGFTPKQILDAVRISAQLQRWSRKGPPPYGSWLYRRQFEQWKRFDAELQDLFGDLGPRHPLADWAKQILVAADRPDFRKQPYREARRVAAGRQESLLQGLLESSASRLAEAKSSEASVDRT